MTDEAKKLIEVAMPIKEVSAESVRDKSIRHGHISTLHLWWARRPLPVCRAVVFASLVPDPLDKNCPKAFAAAVDTLLGKEVWYKPYDEEKVADEKITVDKYSKKCFNIFLITDKRKEPMPLIVLNRNRSMDAAEKLDYFSINISSLGHTGKC